MRRNGLFFTLILTSCLAMTGCYRTPAPQGNFITPHDASKVRKGMSISQVVATLGNPVVNNLYINGELAYVYTYKKGFATMKKKRLMVFFHNNRVTRVTFAKSDIAGHLPASDQ